MSQSTSRLAKPYNAYYIDIQINLCCLTDIIITVVVLILLEFSPICRPLLRFFFMANRELMPKVRVNGL